MPSIFDWSHRARGGPDAWLSSKAGPTSRPWRCTEVDRTRERFNRYFFGAAATQLVHYDLVLNTGRVPLDSVVAGVAALVRQQWPSGEADSSAERRVMTLTGELGAGDSSLAATLAQRLKLSVFDRELLAHERGGWVSAWRSWSESTSSRPGYSSAFVRAAYTSGASRRWPSS